jgi:adenylylsulfate kinase
LPVIDAEHIPVLLVTGPVGVGKTTTAAAVSWLLSEQGVRHARVDLDEIGIVRPHVPNDPWNDLLAHRNLACMWTNFREVGAERLILSRVLETRNLLARIEHAVPGAAVVVVRLKAPVSVIHTRIRGRTLGNDAWHLDRATELVDVMDEQHVEDYLIENTALTIQDTAAEALRFWNDSMGLRSEWS